MQDLLVEMQENMKVLLSIVAKHGNYRVVFYVFLQNNES